MQPLPRSAVDRKVQHLCARCANLDVGGLLNRHNAAAFGEELTIWSWNDYDSPDWLSSPCAFCQLVAVIKKPHDTSQAGLWYFAPPEYLYLLPSFKSKKPIALGLKKDVRRLTIDGTASTTLWRDKEGRTWRTWTLFLASRGSVYGQGELLVRRLDDHYIDFDIPKAWLAQDGASSSSSKSSAIDDIPARLIDCQTMMVVSAAAHPYLALSYVWGRTAFDTDEDYLGSEGELPRHLPATIADAISATKKLGYRYLWVDKYTIDQKNELSRLHDIQNMDAIFHGADATLVAAVGVDADFGLPGVYTRPRQPTLTAHLRDFDFIVVPSTTTLQDSIRQSKYTERGWTFQESMLAERLLIFTHYELYFESRKGNRRERLQVPFPHLDSNIFISHKPVSDPWNAYNPEHVNEAIAEYSSRDLSRQEDALLAALGFLKEFRKGPNPVFHHWGVPIFPDQAIGLGHGRTSFPYLGPKAAAPFSDQGFLLGLCWRPAGDPLIGNDTMFPQRRGKFILPSWSWVGWACTLDPKPQTVYEIQQFHAHPDDKVFVQLGDKAFLPLRCLFNPQATGRMESYYIHLDVRTIGLDLKHIRRDDMTPAQRDQYPDEFALVCEGVEFPFCYGGWGRRGDSFVSLLPAKELREWAYLAPSSTPLIGIVLGRFEDKQDWPYGKHFIMVACEHMSGFFHERVGHIAQGDQRVGLEVRQILEKSMRRQRIRLR